MGNGYKCQLSKETLIYNITYRFKDCITEEDYNEVVRTIIENFEDKSDK